MNKLKRIATVFGITSVMSLNIAFATTGKIVTETIRIREEASTESKIVEMGSLNEEVEIIGQEGNWYKVNFKGKEGYIYNKYVKVDEEPVAEQPVETPATETTTPTEEPTVQSESTENNVETTIGNVTTQKSSLRLLPNITATKVAEIEQGKTVTLKNTVANWTKIEISGVEGWIPNVALMQTQATPVQEEQPQTTTEPEEQPEVDETTEAQINKSAYISSNASAHMRSGPGKENESLGKLPHHTVITVISEENGWYKVNYNGKEGYISKELVTIGEVPQDTSSRNQEVPRTTSESNIVTSTNTSGVVSTAQSYLGSKYVSGGASPSGFDCSGFTQYVYGQCGISISRTSSAQASNGTAVSKSELQPGDLLLFTYYGGSSIGHVGIYVGDGQFIHAANANRGVVYDTINSGYYAENYVGARRF